jgi:hypothetical protein
LCFCTRCRISASAFTLANASYKRFSPVLSPPIGEYGQAGTLTIEKRRINFRDTGLHRG